MAADDDYKCDLCGTVRKQRDMTLVSPELFKEAVRVGLRPDHVWSASAGVVSELDPDAYWVPTALEDNTGWGLCQGCTSRVASYLPNDGTWSTRAPRSEA